MAGLRVWAGQLGVLVPWGAITIAAPGPPWAPSSICDTGVNKILKEKKQVVP